MKKGRLAEIGSALAGWVAAVGVMFFPLMRGRVLAPLDLLDGLLRPWSDGECGAGVHTHCTVDAIRQHIPYDWAVFDSLRKDGFIGWDPCSYGGRAIAENTMLCPGDWHHALYRLIDFWSAWNLGIILQFFIAGAGMIVLLFSEARADSMVSEPEQKSDRKTCAVGCYRQIILPAIVGACAFAFYSQNIAWIHHRFVLGCACFLPWLAWSLRKTARLGRSISLAAIIFTALSFRGGTLQTCIYPVLVGIFLLSAEMHSANWSAKRLPRLLALYGSAAVGGAILSADVLADTLGPVLAGARELHHWTWREMLCSLPTIATSFFPTLLGTPDSLDGFRFFNQHQYFIRYAGGIPLCLALAAFFRKDAPLAPKLLFAGSLALHFSPLNTWLYNRSTVIYAMGLAWLAAWQLANIQGSSSRFWNTVFGLFAVSVLLWVAIGCAATIFDTQLSSELHDFTRRSLPPDQFYRLPWIEVRTDRFIRLLHPWSSVNLAFLIPMGIGLWLCRRQAMAKNTRQPSATLSVGCIAVCAYAELFAFSRLWLTFSELPRQTVEGPFPDSNWTRLLRDETINSGYIWVDRTNPDADFFTLNVHSGFGLRFFGGSDTITPARRLKAPADNETFDPATFAKAGISHIVANPLFPVSPGLSVWTRIPVDETKFLLFKNPAFDSLAHAKLQNGNSVAVSITNVGRNHVRMKLPAGTTSVDYLANYHEKWTATIDDGTNAKTVPTASGMRIELETGLSRDATLALDFRR